MRNPRCEGQKHLNTPHLGNVGLGSPSVFCDTVAEFRHQSGTDENRSTFSHPSSSSPPLSGLARETLRDARLPRLFWRSRRRVTPLAGLLALLKPTNQKTPSPHLTAGASPFLAGEGEGLTRGNPTLSVFARAAGLLFLQRIC